MNQNPLKEVWKEIEAKGVSPIGITNVRELELADLKQLVEEENLLELRNLAESMYAGEAFILRNAAPPQLKEVMRQLADDYAKSREPEFHKMLDGCPNFHRIIDAEITKKYSLYAIKHSFYLYNWNVRTELEKQFTDLVYDHWRYVKFVAGNGLTDFESNIPSQGQVDRLQIINYPRGGGELREHEDPRKNQRIVSGLIMSKLGEDFKTGGFYFRTADGGKVNLEENLNICDSVMFYGSIRHGVEPVDPERELNWDLNVGRWFIGMFVNDSDHVQDRVTAFDVTQSVELNNGKA
jgi:hypothetical protein